MTDERISNARVVEFPRTPVAPLRGTPLHAFLLEEDLGPDWLVGDLLPPAGITLLGGEAKIGKTLLAMNLAMAVASPDIDEVLGRPVTAHGPVLFVETEGRGESIRRRFTSLLAAHEMDPANVNLEVVMRHDVRIDTEEGVTALETGIDDYRPRLVVIDPLSNVHRVDENLAGAIGPVMADLRRIAMTASTSVLLVHHTSKPGPSGHGSPSSRLRGSTALTAATEANLVLSGTSSALTLTGSIRDARSQTLKLAIDPETLVARTRESDRGEKRPNKDEAVALLIAAAREAGGITVEQALQITGLKSATTVRGHLDSIPQLVKEKEGRADVWLPVS